MILLAQSCGALSELYLVSGGTSESTSVAYADENMLELEEVFHLD